MKKWYVYIAECADGSLYTGITNNLKRRIWEHNYDNRLGAKSVKHRGPSVLFTTSRLQVKLRRQTGKNPLKDGRVNIN